MNLSETVGTKGAYETFLRLEKSSKTFYEHDDILALMTECGVTDPASLLQDFTAAGLVARTGDLFALSSFGIRTTLLLEAINGSDLRDIYRRLTSIDSSLRTYELIREGMTKTFLRNINERPGFVRLYFCSPWISLDARQRALLTHAVIQSSRSRGAQPELLVITRPKEDAENEPPDAIQPFRDLGANVFLNKRLHTKLYIREPGTSGGYSMAILGSQNLTRSNYLELGIRINADTQMVDQLIAYFWEITNYSHEA